MKLHRTLTLATAAAGLLLAIPAAADAGVADQLGLYDFREFTTNYVAAPGPYLNYSSSPLASSSTMVNVGAGALEADTTRDSTNAALGSFALLIGAGNLASTTGSDIPPPPVSSTDYLGFTVTSNTDNLDLGTFSFDLGTSIGANTNSTSGGITFDDLTTNAQLFYSTDGGTSFNPIGPLVVSVADNANNTGAFTGMNNYSIDLSSLGLLNTGQTIEFRLGFSDNRGGGSNLMGHYVDNFVLSGTAIPEPASLGLLGLAGVGLLARRRR